MQKSMYGNALLRIVLGAMFLFAGIAKLTNVDGPTQMLGNMVLFSWAPAFWAWVLVLSEIIFGLALVIGWKTKYVVWPLVAIMAIATLFVVFPGVSLTKTSGLFFHLLAIAVLVHLYLNGPGAWALDKK